MAIAVNTPRVTIGDVAAQAGVSIATVSRVVNGRYGVAPGTITRVREAIALLDFETSLVARSLRSQRTNVIGILVAGIEPFSAELLKGAARAIEDTGYELIVYSGGMHGKEGWERRSLSRLSGTLTDGTILVTPSVVDVGTVQPVVAVDPHVGGSLPTIDAQNYEGAVSATRYLLGLGHRRIGFLAGRADLESARRREAGYAAALAEAGIVAEPGLVQAGGFTEETAAAPARALLTMPDRPSAIFAANDLSAIQVLRTAAELGLQVPGDVSVIGFDNIPESALVDPPLTTVDQSIQAQGEAAVRLLIELIDDPGRRASPDLAHITMPAELVVRHSCGPVSPA